MTLNHLQRLEAESIHLLREVFAEAARPVMLNPVDEEGTVSAVLLRLVDKAFYPKPADPPIPLLRVDSARETRGIEQVIRAQGYDVVFDGGRRDRDTSGAGKRFLAVRTARPAGASWNQQPEPGLIYNSRKRPDELLWVFPLSNWTEDDVREYLHCEKVATLPRGSTTAEPGYEQEQAALRAQPLRLPIQLVNASSASFRGYAGTIVAGRLWKGDRIRVLPFGQMSRVARIVTFDGDLDEAVAGQSITITLEDPVVVSRGDLITAAESPAEVADQFEATVAWINQAPLLPGRSYLLKIGAKTVTATIAPLKYKIDPASAQRLAAATLELNEIGVCNLQLDGAIAFDAYKANRDTGGFILIDRQSNDTVGAGMLHFALRRAQNVHWQALDVNKAARSAIKGQRPCVLWYTGLSGAGKSTIANMVDQKLHSMQRHTYLLDGDNVRHGLNRDLGFTDVDRVENIRRIAEVAKLMVDAGLIVSTAFISPFRAERQTARALLPPGEFIEIFIDTPLGVAEQRDPKGLYKKARRGDLKNFTGIDSPYEGPVNPEIRIDTTTMSPAQAAEAIVTHLRARGMFDSL